jgi:acyl-CoA reductase-like NAD-dependent aldehyde dehydrogenase
LESTEGRIVCGGKYEMSSRFIEPTLIEAEESDITMKQEIFGPILPIITLPCLEDAIKLIRRHEKPLVSYLFSDSKKAIERFQAVESGTLTINDTIMHMTLDSLPFGGVGKSGMGRYHGKFTFDAFSHQKAVLHRSSAFEKLLWMRYPPFKGTDKLAWVHRMSSKIRMPL